jgi:hypothetical protein
MLDLVDDGTAADVGGTSRGDRPASGDLPGRLRNPEVDLADELRARIAELDAVAWNLPTRGASASTARDENDLADD